MFTCIHTFTSINSIFCLGREDLPVDPNACMHLLLTPRPCCRPDHPPRIHKQRFICEYEYEQASLGFPDMKYPQASSYRPPNPIRLTSPPRIQLHACIRQCISSKQEPAVSALIQVPADPTSAVLDHILIHPISDLLCLSNPRMRL